MSEKKHKSGYELLKEKLAKAEAKNAELQKEKEILVQTAQDNYCRVEKERDEWKAKYAVKTSELESTVHGQAISIRGLSMDNTELSKKVAFLLDHCPFWVRWMYRKQFE